MATLNLRGFDDEVAKGIKHSAGARGMTLPEYVAALYRLHRILVEAALHGYPGDSNPETDLAILFLMEAQLPLVFA
jgi:hypothetical protein